MERPASGTRRGMAPAEHAPRVQSVLTCAVCCGQHGGVVMLHQYNVPHPRRGSAS